MHNHFKPPEPIEPKNYKEYNPGLIAPEGVHQASFKKSAIVKDGTLLVIEFSIPGYESIARFIDIGPETVFDESKKSKFDKDVKWTLMLIDKLCSTKYESFEMQRKWFMSCITEALNELIGRNIMLTIAHYTSQNGATRAKITKLERCIETNASSQPEKPESTTTEFFDDEVPF